MRSGRRRGSEFCARLFFGFGVFWGCSHFGWFLGFGGLPKTDRLPRKIDALRADCGVVGFVRFSAFKRHKNQIWGRRPPRVMGCFCRHGVTRKSTFLRFGNVFPLNS